MKINRLLHAYVEPDGCWHELMHTRCKKCGITEPIPNPDYSTPVHFKRLTDKLLNDLPMWKSFYAHCANDGWYLFQDWERFCYLFSEFLRLPETVEEFGWEECECKGEPIRGDKLVWCLKCNGTGKILKPWAKMVKEDGDES